MLMDGDESPPPPGSLGDVLARLRREASQWGAHHVTAGVDQLDARLRDERDQRLFGELDTP